MTTELIAKHDFGLEAGRRRTDDPADVRVDKGIDLQDVLVAVYAIVAGILTASSGVLVGQTTIGMIAGTAVFVALIVVYRGYIVPKYEKTVAERIETFQGE